MKLKNIILIGIAAIGFASCNDWLDIQPKTEIKLDKMFETESGFKNALIGGYIMMTDSLIYGREMTITFMDVLAQQFEVKGTGNPYYYAKFYDYTRYKSTTENFWIKNYRIIANMNAILEQIDGKKDILHPTHYANIKAEALALRGFLHLDLLRMFGTYGTTVDPSKLDQLSIPYVTEYSKNISEQLSGKKVLELILKDLKEAEKLSEYWSPYNQVPQDENYERPNDDKFYEYPRSRMNYWAIKATQARAYMWMGDYTNALEAVKGFINKDKPAIKWMDPDDAINVEAKQKDLTFTTEHIFYINVTNLYNSLRPYVESYLIHGEFTQSENDDFLYKSEKNLNDTYEMGSGTGIGTSDYRYAAWWDKNSIEKKVEKFREVTDSESPSKNKVPLIRKPEMFYIAAECYNNLNQTAEAVKLLNEVRVARGIPYANNLPEGLSKEECAQEIEKEWKKEYISEGQLFYYYKRLGKEIQGASMGASDNMYKFPLPEKEIEIGGRQ